MMLKTRFAILLAGFVLLLVGSAVTVTQFAIIPQAMTADSEDVDEVFSRAAAVQAEARDSLLGTLSTWASRDEALAFVAGKTGEDSVESMLREMRLTCLVLLDARGQPAHVRTTDAGQPDVSATDVLISHIRGNANAMGAVKDRRRVAGYSLAEGILWLVAMVPAPTAAGDGISQSGRVLLTGRRMSADEVSRLAAQIHPSLRFRPAEGMLAPGERSVTALSPRSLRARQRITDAWGGNAMEMEVTLARRTFVQGVTTLLYLAGWIAVCGAAVTAVSFLFLDRWVLRDLTESIRTLQTGIASIATNSSTWPMLRPRKSDEMGRLAGSIDEMLERLMTSQIQLRTSEARYRGLVAATPEAIVGLDSAGRIVFANRAFLRHIGVADESETTGKSLLDVMQGPAAEAINVQRETVGTDASIELGPSKAILAGTTRWVTAVLTRVTPVEGVTGYVLLCINDVTAKIEAEAEAERRRAEAVQAQKLAALGTLVAGMAHEVNNPNSVIGINAVMLGRLMDRHFAQTQPTAVSNTTAPQDAASVEREMREIVTEIQTASSRIAGLVSSLKRFARSSEETIPEPVDISATVRQAREWLRHDIQRRQCRVEEALADGLPRVNGNAQQLQQVFMNLIQNALNAMGPAGGRLRLVSAYDPEEGRVAITVEDNGEGIRPEDIDRVTDPFFTTRRGQGGTGLGLSISATIVKAHGGTLRVASVLGEGTRVRVELPASKEGTHVG